MAVAELIVPNRNLADNQAVGMEHWPQDAFAAMQRLLNTHCHTRDRRKVARYQYNVTGKLVLDNIANIAPLVYTRDVNAWFASFITKEELTIGTPAILQLRCKKNWKITAACRVRRCQDIGDGWFESNVEFSQPQGRLV